MRKLKNIFFPRKIVFTQNNPQDCINWLTQKRHEETNHEKLETCSLKSRLHVKL